MIETFKEMRKGITYPYAIISDVHCHKWTVFSSIDTKTKINSRLQTTLDAIKFAAETLLEQGGKDLIITGDLFHTRGSLPPSVLNPVLELFAALAEKGIHIHGFDGNHDAEDKRVSFVGSALYPMTLIKNATIYYEPTIVDEKFLFLPWEDEPEKILEATTKGSNLFPMLTVFCHVGMSGVLPGNLGHTLSPKDFDKLGVKYVFSGHFHNHVSFNSRIYSVGALTHQTWSDAGSLAGFILVTENEVKHLKTKAPIFMDIFDGNPEDHAGNYVRIRGEYTEQEHKDIIQFLNDNNVKGITDQSTRPSIVKKEYKEEITVTDGLNKALESYCRYNYGDDWKKVYDACLKLKN